MSDASDNILPHPHPDFAPSNTSDGVGSDALASRAKNWRPKNTTAETPASTVSRYALRLIDRSTGKAYSADELGVTNAAVAAAIAEDPDASRSALGQKQPVTHIAIFGDSRASQTSGVSAAQYAHGPLYWIQLATGSRLTPVKNPASGGFSFSYGGYSFGDLNDDDGAQPMVANLIAAAPVGTVVFMYCGVNGMDDPATEYADFQTVTERFQAAGLYPVALLEPYLGTSDGGPYYVTERDTYNTNVRTYCLANNVPFIDGMELYGIGTADESYDLLFYNDGGYIHPNMRGASAIGIAAARAIENAYELPDFPVSYRTIKESPTPNAGFVSGSMGNGTTTGFTASGTNCTLSTTMVRRTDGQPGYWAEFDISACGEGASVASTGAGYVNCYNTLGIASLTPGTYKLVCDIEIDTWDEGPASASETNLRNISLEVTVSGGTSAGTYRVGSSISAVQYQAHTVGNRQSISPLRNVHEINRKFALVLTDIVIAADATSVISKFLPYGNGKIRVGNLALVKE